MMAHSNETKAYALALLICGERVNHVAERTGVPKQTISRWRADADQLLVGCFIEDGRYPTLGELGFKMGLNETENMG